MLKDLGTSWPTFCVCWSLILEGTKLLTLRSLSVMLRLGRIPRKSVVVWGSCGGVAKSFAEVLQLPELPLIVDGSPVKKID